MRPPHPARLEPPERLLRQCRRSLWVADGQPATRIEELQVAGVYAEVERLAVSGPALLGHPRGPQRLAAGERGRRLVLVLAGLGRLREAGVLHVRGVDGEDHHNLA